MIQEADKRRSRVQSVSDSVGYVATGCFGRSDDLHDLAFADAEVARNGVFALNLGQLTLLCTAIRTIDNTIIVKHPLKTPLA